jgi:hypothetical protein
MAVQQPKPQDDTLPKQTKLSAPTPPDSLATNTASVPFDLDGMTLMTDVEAPPVAPEPTLRVSKDLQSISKSPEEHVGPATAIWAPMMEEVSTSSTSVTFSRLLTLT